MKKKACALVLAVCMLFSLSACGGGTSRESAETVVKNALDAVKSCDLDKMAEYWGDEAIGTDDFTDDFVSEETIQAIFSGLTYEILDSEEKESTATVEVKISNVDMTQVMTDAMTELFSALSDEDFLAEIEQMTEEEAAQFFIDQFVEVLQRPDNARVENTVTVPLSLVDGKWVIDDATDDVVDAMLGGISALDDAMSGLS